jgi:lysophospholipase L1-like esterase
MRSLAVVLAASLLVLGAAVAGAARGASPAPSYYLALGDSIAYGYQPTKEKPGAVPADYDTGYVDVVAAQLTKSSPDLQLANYGCPGESTVTFARGGCPAFPNYFKPHSAYRGAQLAAALSFLRDHGSDDVLVTLSLYGNDWLPVVLETCKGDVACVRKRGPRAIAAFESRLTAIVRQLRAAAPTAEIVVTGAWNPEPSQLASLKPIYRSLEAAIARAATASQARTAPMVPVFNAPGTRKAQRARLCRLTFICSRGDPHPTDAGYRAMAAAVLRAAG